MYYKNNQITDKFIWRHFAFSLKNRQNQYKIFYNFN